MSWLDMIPVSTTVYAFQAALLCEDCGTTMVNYLKEHGVVDDGDSGTFPQGPFQDGGGEADGPQFCDRGRECVNALGMTPHGRKIGCPLDNPLTSDGALTLVQMIKSDLVSSDAHQRLVGRLLAKVWQPYAVPAEHLGPWDPRKKMPYFAVRKLLNELGLKVARPVALDTESIYLVAEKDNDASYLLRSAVNDDGSFTKVDSIIVPTSASYDPYELVAEAVTDSAWD